MQIVAFEHYLLQIRNDIKLPQPPRALRQTPFIFHLQFHNKLSILYNISTAYFLFGTHTFINLKL